MKRLTKLLFFTALFFGAEAHAFDRIQCEADLKGWIISLTESSKLAVLTPQKQSGFFEKKYTEVLYFKNTSDETVAAVFPWNTLYVRKYKALEKRYQISSSENDYGFSVEITEASSGLTRHIDCRFTF